MKIAYFLIYACKINTNYAYYAEVLAIPLSTFKKIGVLTVKSNPKTRIEKHLLPSDIRLSGFAGHQRTPMYCKLEKALLLLIKSVNNLGILVKLLLQMKMNY
eukprot:NODE_348_length_8996_cov_0.416433.p8 type:complete len:102 gc:universal NODE_348_length_8996_cov_0.416433:6992-6687(-)